MNKAPSGLDFSKRQDSGKRNMSLVQKQSRPMDEKNYPMTTKEHGTVKPQNLNTLMTGTQMPNKSVRSTKQSG